MKDKVVIAGGSGLIGTTIREILEKQGYPVAMLTTREELADSTSYFFWNPSSGIIDSHVFDNAKHLINLSGAGIAEKRWTKKRKAFILNSRINATRFLLETLTTNNIFLESYTGASAIGYYGNNPLVEPVKEESAAGSDFLSEVCVKWEEESTKLSRQASRVIILRISNVLSARGGMLKELTKPAKIGFPVVLGSGKQKISWIHEADLACFVAFTLENKTIQGTFNLCAPEIITHRKLIEHVAAVYNRKIWLPPVPSFLLKLMLGEMAEIITSGIAVSNEKLVLSGYKLQFEKISKALVDLLKNKK